MLEDRPVMALHVRDGDDIWDWAVHAYAGDDLGFRVYWERAAPRSGSSANHTFPRPGQVALLRIRPIHASSTAAFEDGWSCFTYEMQNLKSAAAYLAVHEGAASGRLDRREYVRRNTLLEFLAIERTRQFYEEVWVPWCRVAGITPTPHKWYVGGAATYDDWTKTGSGRHMNEFWERAFDARWPSHSNRDGQLRQSSNAQKPRGE